MSTNDKVAIVSAEKPIHLKAEGDQKCFKITASVYAETPEEAGILLGKTIDQGFAQLQERKLPAAPLEVNK